MKIKKEFEDLLDNLKSQRDLVKVKIKLASMDVKDEFEEAEEKWQHVKAKASEIADDTKEVSEDFIARAKIVGDELKETYHRINERLSK